MDSRRHAQALLTDNLRKHVKLTAKKESYKENPNAYTSYVETKMSILQTYLNPPHNLDSDVLDEIVAAVGAQVFAEKRKKLENLFAALKTPGKTLSTLQFLSEVDFFVHLYREETYYCFDYFASLGGMDVVVAHAASPASSPRLRLAALNICWSFATESKRVHLLADKGIIDAIENVLKTMKNHVQMILAACGITRGLVEYPDLRVSIRENTYNTINIYIYVLFLESTAAKGLCFPID